MTRNGFGPKVSYELPAERYCFDAQNASSNPSRFVGSRSEMNVLGREKW
jgi:hypothetical protein